MAILIIDDDPVVAGLVADVLSEEGYRATCAASPEEAMAVLSAQGQDAFSLVLTQPFAGSHDDAYGWLDQLRTRTSAAIIVCSDNSVYATCQAHGCAAVLHEPFSLLELTGVVASVSNGAPARPAATTPHAESCPAAR